MSIKCLTRLVRSRSVILWLCPSAIRSVPGPNVLGHCRFSFLSCSVDMPRTHQSTSSSPKDNNALRVMCRSRVDSNEDAALSSLERNSQTPWTSRRSEFFEVFWLQRWRACLLVPSQEHCLHFDVVVHTDCVGERGESHERSSAFFLCDSIAASMLRPS